MEGNILVWGHWEINGENIIKVYLSSLGGNIIGENIVFVTHTLIKFKRGREIVFIALFTMVDVKLSL